MKNSKIKNIKAREILDSRGNPTVEVELETFLGTTKASVPSGASTGKYEALEIRDGGKRYNGKGVRKVVRNVNEKIFPKLKGKNVANQKEVDDFLIKLDGTENKSKLGANAICGVSMAACRAGAKFQNLSLYQYINQIYCSAEPKLKKKSSWSIPLACFNVINGGAHAGNELDFQEFMIVPQSKSFSENLKIGVEVYQQLKEIISQKYGKEATNLGDEGGFAPPLRFPEEALELISKAVEDLNYKDKIKFISDVAASQFWEKDKYKTSFNTFSSKELLQYYLALIKKYPIIGLEDPFSEEDWEAWKLGNSEFKKVNCLLIGDDLLATNPQRIKMAEEKSACNGAIIKINQIGTVSEAIKAAKLAQSYGWKIMVSHRSGETTDDFISDLAVGIGADFIKAGAPARGERVVKYNRLLKIEGEI